MAKKGLDHENKSCKCIGSDMVYIEFQVLFLQLLTAVVNSKELEDFRYELCHYPNLPLYKSSKGLYVKYLQHRYDHAFIVLDAFLIGPSYKDLTCMHYNKSCMGPEIHFTPDMTCTLSKEVSMPITNKKPQLIQMVSYSLLAECCDVLLTATDAGTLPVETTMAFAKQHNIVFGRDDTALLVPFVPKLILVPIEYTFTLRQSQLSKVPDSIEIYYKCSKISLNISRNTCYMHMLYLLVIHTSQVFGIGKMTPIMKMKSCLFFK